MLNFNISEKMFLLSIDDNSATILASAKATLRYGLAGALLAELAMANKIQLLDGCLALVDQTITGDAFFDDALALMAAEKKPRKLSRWIDIVSRKQIVKRVTVRLVERNAIRVEKKHYLWVIPYEAYPQVDASAKYWVKQHLRNVVLAGEKAEAPDIALLSLLKACRFLRLLFTRDERKYASKKVDALVKGEVFGEAVTKLLEEMDAAMVAVTVAATTASYS